METKRATAILTDLVFPTGVALNPSEDYVLAVESVAYRIRQKFVSTMRTDQMFFDGFMGFVSAFHYSKSLNQYMAVIEQDRCVALDWLHDLPYIKKLMSKFCCGSNFIWRRIMNWLFRSTPIVSKFVLMDVNGNLIRGISANPDLISMHSFTDIVEGTIGNVDYLLFVGSEQKSIGLLRKDILTQSYMPSLNSVKGNIIGGRKEKTIEKEL